MASPGPSQSRHHQVPLDDVIYAISLERYVAQPTLANLEDLERRHQQKQRLGRLTDRDIATGLLIENAREIMTFNSDRVIAQRMQNEQNTNLNGDVVGANQNQTNRIATGTATALAATRTTQINAVHTPTRTTQNNPRRPNATQQNTQTWGAWFASLVGWTDQGPQPSNARPASALTNNPNTHTATVSNAATNGKRLTGHDCVICQDPIRGAEIRTPCGHFYDIECITNLFEAATRDESLFPPRCCRQNIALALVQRHLSVTLLRTFQEKSEEFGALKRVYCAAPTCSRFLGPLHDGSKSKTYTCTAQGCTTVTCAKCRVRYEGWNHSCQPDGDQTTEQLLALSRTQGWARCPGCAQMIELNMGCFHMTCRCRTEFCYLCTARWKTCRCPQWDENRLMAAAERRVDLQLGRPPGGAAPRPGAQAREDRALQWQDIARPAAPPAPIELPRPRVAPALAPAARITQRIEAVPPRTEVRATPAPAQAYRNPTHQIAEEHRRRLVRQAMDDLRVNHDCAHTAWAYRRGGGRCENCHVHLPHYLYRCGGCQMMACNRCRRNRL